VLTGLGLVANFREATSIIASKLEERLQKTSFKIQLPPREVIELTDGWRSDLGVVRRDLRLEVWLDNYFIDGNRQFYICFYSPKTLERFLRITSRNFGKTVHIVQGDITTAAPYRLCKPLARQATPFPVYEKYAGEEYLGLCDVATTHDGRPSGALVKRACTFVETIVRADANVS
jgi:hypothetical protein